MPASLFQPKPTGRIHIKCWALILLLVPMLSFAQTAALKPDETAKIKKYTADHNLAVTVTPLGLNYVITRPGQGDKIAVGDTAVVWYVLRFVDGKIFQTNIVSLARQGNPNNAGAGVYKPIRVQAGMRRVIPGWDEALLLLNKGAKATFIIPSSLAYGEKGLNIIPPYTPLVCEIEVIDIIKAH
jgi:FKBP-type peptidyl-prolyl cis-trans isomerase FkpA